MPAHEADGESFLLLKEDDFKEMLPLVGPRTKLLKKRSELTVNLSTNYSPVYTTTFKMDIA